MVLSNPYVYPISDKGINSILVSKIIKATCHYFDIKPFELKGRKSKYAFPRFILIYILYKKGIDKSEILGMFGKHRTSLYPSVKRIEGFISIKDERTLRAINEITGMCNIKISFESINK